MSLRSLLYADLARQYELEDRSVRKPNFLRFLARALHFRFLPNVIRRLSRATHLAHLPLIPHLFTYLNIALFGLEVTPKCEIGPGVFFAHSVGTVVEAARLGRNVTILGGVTLGAKTLAPMFDPATRPVVGDNVVLGAGCKVLGAIEIGNAVTVGANAVVLESVPHNATVVGIPARVM